LGKYYSAVADPNPDCDPAATGFTIGQSRFFSRSIAGFDLCVSAPEPDAVALMSDGLFGRAILGRSATILKIAIARLRPTLPGETH
jgi:hypothetical protein